MDSKKPCVKFNEDRACAGCNEDGVALSGSWHHKWSLHDARAILSSLDKGVWHFQAKQWFALRPSAKVKRRSHLLIFGYFQDAGVG